MRACVFASAFLLSMSIIMGLSNTGYAQQRGGVGITLTLKPIQTIQVDLRESGRVIARSATRPGTPMKRALVMDFGTSTYGVTVDRITTDSLAVLRSEAVGEKSRSGRSQVGGHAGGHQLIADRGRTLVVYSIRVH